MFQATKLRSLWSKLQALRFKFSRFLDALKRSARPSVDWGCIDSLLRVSKSLKIDILGDNPRMGLYIVPWRPDDELIFANLAQSVLEVDCLDDIYEAEMVIFAVCWPGMDPPTQLDFAEIYYQITPDGYLCNSDIRVGRWIVLGDDHQAFAVLPKWALIR